MVPLLAVEDAPTAPELLHELDYTLFPRWPFLVRDESHTYRMPADRPSLPLMYTLRATKPA